MSLFRGVEFVADRETKKPFKPDRQVSETVFDRGAVDSGLLVYPTAGIIDGIHGDGVIISPAYTASLEDIEEVVIRFKRAVVSVFGS